MMWDFYSLRSETLYEMMFVHLDRGIPDGYRHMDAFTVNTFKLVNAKEEEFFCKFTYKVQLVSYMDTSNSY